jgi:hypothetical protein
MSERFLSEEFVPMPIIYEVVLVPSGFISKEGGDIYDRYPS